MRVTKERMRVRRTGGAPGWRMGCGMELSYNGWRLREPRRGGRKEEHRGHGGCTEGHKVLGAGTSCERLCSLSWMAMEKTIGLVIKAGGSPARLPLYLGFAATGVGVALPGALLPALLVRWHLGDEQGGRLFLMAWIGSSVGSLLVKGSLRTVILLGSLATALAAIGLGVCHGHGADVLMGLYGVGLGMTMTAISLIRQQQAMNWGHAQSGTEMVRLNLLWAIGACAAPSLTVRALTVGAIRPLLFGLAFCFLLLAVWAAMQADVRLVPVSAGELDDCRVPATGVAGVSQGAAGAGADDAADNRD